MRLFASTLAASRSKHVACTSPLTSVVAGAPCRSTQRPRKGDPTAFAVLNAPAARPTKPSDVLRATASSTARLTIPSGKRARKLNPTKRTAPGVRSTAAYRPPIISERLP